jgi:hypothetical protein
MDDCDQFFPAKAKKKKGKKVKKENKANSSTRFKKCLLKWKKKNPIIDEKSRVTIIGCTSNPLGSNSKKEF